MDMLSAVTCEEGRKDVICRSICGWSLCCCVCVCVCVSVCVCAVLLVLFATAAAIKGCTEASQGV